MDRVLGQIWTIEPLYLMSGGVVFLLLILVSVLLVIGKRRAPKKERGLSPSHQKSHSAPPAFEKERLQEDGNSFVGPSDIVNGIKVETGEKVGSDNGPFSLAVFENPFEETPNIGRESFEDFRGKRILMVEDNPVNRKLISTLMKGSDIELDLAVDGVEALEKLRQSDAGYDLVLMDVNMPKMNGLECTRKIRSDSTISMIPVVALTASTTPKEVKAILESGMNGYLSKPINLGKLYTAFAQFLGRDQAEDAPPVVSVSAESESEVPALDTTIGLEHAGNDPELYRMLLEDFLEQYSDSGKRIASYTAQKDYEALNRLVIDLGGLSGTLGAMELYAILLKTIQGLKRVDMPMLSELAREYSEAFKRFEEETERYLRS